MKKTTYQLNGCSKTSAKREISINPWKKKKEKPQINKITLLPSGTYYNRMHLLQQNLKIAKTVLLSYVFACVLSST